MKFSGFFVCIMYFRLNFVKTTFEGFCPDNSFLLANHICDIDTSPSECNVDDNDNIYCADEEKICCYDYYDCRYICTYPDKGCFSEGYEDKCVDQRQICCWDDEECKFDCMDPSYYRVSCPETISCSFGAVFRWVFNICSEGSISCPNDCFFFFGACVTPEYEKAECPARSNNTCPSEEPSNCSTPEDCVGNDKLCCSDSNNVKCCQEPSYVKEFPNVR